MNQALVELKAATRMPQPARLPAQLTAATAGDSNAQIEICGALLWVAFACPAATLPVYDALFGDVGAGHFDPEGLVADIPESFWQAFQETVDGPEGGYDPSTITAAVAALGGATADNFHELAEQAAEAHPGAVGAASKVVPPLLEIESLQNYAEGSLGRTLYKMLVENGYDAEVLDREAIGLANLLPAMRYLNTRILQMHDVWHLVADYETTGSHEIAISAFQLAQFNHNYSAMFLATVATVSQRNGTDGFNLMMQIYGESWRHGRQTPPLMAIPFEQEWQSSITEIRRKYGIKPFVGSLPADLFERLRAAS